MKYVPNVSVEEAANKSKCDHPESRLLKIVNSVGGIMFKCYCLICGSATTQFLPHRLILNPAGVPDRADVSLCIDDLLRDERRSLRIETDNFRANYMRSDQWKRLCAAVRERAMGRCERCANAPVENVHHMTYRSVGNEAISELAGLCRECHETVHGIRQAA